MIHKLHLEDLEEDDDDAKNENIKESVLISNKMTNDEKRTPMKSELSNEELVTNNI